MGENDSLKNGTSPSDKYTKYPPPGLFQNILSYEHVFCYSQVGCGTRFAISQKLICKQVNFIIREYFTSHFICLIYDSVLSCCMSYLGGNLSFQDTGLYHSNRRSTTHKSGEISLMAGFHMSYFIAFHRISWQFVECP